MLKYIILLNILHKMDIQKKKRSFQNKNMSLQELIFSITNSYGRSDFILNLPNNPIGRLWVQYEETDWEFVKRIASYYNAGLFPNKTLEGIHYFVSTPNRDIKNIEINEYTISKLIEDYDLIRENDLPDSNEFDYIRYQISSYEILELGDYISLNEHQFYVSELTYEMEDSILKNTYSLQPKEGQKQLRMYNEKLKGISIEGSVIEVMKDEIKVKFDIDKEQEKNTAYFFKFSTLAASPDGSGWYFMPEINDRVRVYFPSNDEKDAFAISCIHEIENDPDTKYIATIYGKKIIFTKDSVSISANNQATIVLGKSGGVSISGGSISLNASEKITLRAEDSIIISGKNNVDITCDKGGKTLLDAGGNIELKGNKVKIN